MSYHQTIKTILVYWLSLHELIVVCMAQHHRRRVKMPALARPTITRPRTIDEDFRARLFNTSTGADLCQASDGTCMRIMHVQSATNPIAGDSCSRCQASVNACWGLYFCCSSFGQPGYLRPEHLDEDKQDDRDTRFREGRWSITGTFEAIQAGSCRQHDCLKQASATVEASARRRICSRACCRPDSRAN